MTNQEILTGAKKIEPEIREYRRWLHAHAETGFDLGATKAYVKNTLKKMGYSVSECGKCGLTATVGRGGKVFLLRADMDALPIVEESDVEFPCPTGNMHACGHDLHTAMLLGAAKLLKERESELSGTVKLMFQPAEEIFEGSKDMIENGLLQNPDVDAAVMIHVTAGLPIPSGTVIISAPGVSAPAADYFTIRVQGKGCHGSTPQNGVDALSAAAHILIALQEIHARELNPMEEAVLSIGKFIGGTAENVIADSAILGGTIRTYSEETRAYLKDRMTTIAQSVATAFRATAEVNFGSGCPTLVNDKSLCSDLVAYLGELLGPQGALDAAAFGPSRGGGSEDFAYISQKVPAVMLALAAGEPDKGYSYPQHHPKVKFDEKALPIGAAAFTYCAMRYLEENK